MKMLNWMLKLSGINPGLIIGKVLLWFALAIGVVKGVGLIWWFLASNNPKVRSNTKELTESIANKNDSLRMAVLNNRILNGQILVKDSVIQSLRWDADINKDLEKQRQRLILDQQNQIKRYRDNGVYYLYIKKPFAKDIFKEVGRADIDSLRNK